MKWVCSFLTVMVLIFLSACESPSASIKREFDKVNSSLDKSNTVIASTLEEAYSKINTLRQKNEGLARRADTLYAAAKHAFSYIDSVKGELNRLDSAGTNLTLASRIFISSPAGDSLQNLLLDYYAVASTCPVNSSKRTELDSVLHSIHDIQINKSWKKTYFDNTPTVAAITILSKFQNDIRSSSLIVLEDLAKQLGE